MIQGLPGAGSGVLCYCSYNLNKNLEILVEIMHSASQRIDTPCTYENFLLDLFHLSQLVHFVEEFSPALTF